MDWQTSWQPSTQSSSFSNKCLGNGFWSMVSAFVMAMEGSMGGGILEKVAKK